MVGLGEYDKWTVLRNKADLREIEEYKSFYLEMDRSKEEREQRRLNVKKKVREKGGTKIEVDDMHDRDLRIAWKNVRKIRMTVGVGRMDEDV